MAGNLIVNLNYHYQDSVFADGANDNTIDSYGILNWSAFYKLKEGVSMFSKVSNVTDEVYVHSVLPDGYRVGAPRIWSIGMEFDF